MGSTLHGRPQEALPLLEQAIEFDPESTQVLRGLLWHRSHAGNREGVLALLPRALRVLRREVEAAPARAERIHTLADSLVFAVPFAREAGEADTARDLAAEACARCAGVLTASPDDVGFRLLHAGALEQQGLNLQAQGAWVEARRAFEAGLALAEAVAVERPEDLAALDRLYDLHVAVGSCANTLGDFEATLRHTEARLQVLDRWRIIEPDSAWVKGEFPLAWFSLAGILVNRGRSAEGLDAIDRGSALVDVVPTELHALRAVALERTGQRDEALEALGMLDASQRVAAGEEARLERLARYATRVPLAVGALRDRPGVAWKVEVQVLQVVGPRAADPGQRQPVHAQPDVAPLHAAGRSRRMRFGIG